MINTARKILYRFPLTRLRIFIAGLLYLFIRPFLKDNIRIVTRKGIRYELDLREGIDLAVFLLGHFQKHLFSHGLINLPVAPVIIDIGANIGSISLAYADRFPESRIFAVEPSDCAYKKLLRNISLNPDLKNRILPIQAFISERTEKAKDEIRTFSSWPVDHAHKKEHPVHCGRRTSSCLKETIRLDDFIKSINHQNSEPVKPDLIKIDTDGHEFIILNSGKATIEKYRPVIIFETGKYIMKEFNTSFDEYMAFFTENRYRIYSLQTNTEITKSNWGALIPGFSTIDIIAMPDP